MRNYRIFRRWCAKNVHGYDEASAAKPGLSKKIIIAALCCVTLAGGVFGIKAFAGSFSEDTGETGENAQAVQTAADSDTETADSSDQMLGARIEKLSEAAVRFGLPQGAAIGAVTEGSAADEAGIMTGDIVTAVNGEEVTDACGLLAKLSGQSSDIEFTFSVYRQGSELEMTVRFGSESQQYS